MVLLKNDGVLPLKRRGSRSRWSARWPTRRKVLLGNYNGTPTHTVSILEGIRKEFSGATINYVPGTQFLRTRRRAGACLAHSQWTASRGSRRVIRDWTCQT